MKRARLTPLTAGLLTIAIAAGLASTGAAQLSSEPVRYAAEGREAHGERALAHGAAPLLYYIEEGRASAGYRPGDRELAEWALHAWLGEAASPAELRAASEEEADLRIYWVRAQEGLYGEARTRVIGGRPVAEIFVRPDVAGLGADIEAEVADDPLLRDTIVYLTCVHEIGHALGLPHTASFADIMYSFQYGGDFVGYFRRFRDRLETRDDIPSTSPLSEADLAAYRASR